MLIGWDVCVLLCLVLIYWMFCHSGTGSIKQRSALQDEGRHILLLLTTAAAVASLAVIVIWLGRPPEMRQRLDAFVLLTIPLSWVFIHTMFALHYAHEFYAEHRGSGGGLRFPGGGQPNYWDFVYFAFGIGMAAQVADVSVTAKPIRRVVTVHSIVSFVFNVTLIALTVSIVGDAIKK